MVDDAKLFVGKLPLDIRQDEIEMVFNTYGKVVDVHIMEPKGGQQSKAAFVAYDAAEAAQAAIQVLDGIYKFREDGPDTVRVSIANPKGSKGGGGKGGGGGYDRGGPERGGYDRGGYERGGAGYHRGGGGGAEDRNGGYNRGGGGYDKGGSDRGGGYDRAPPDRGYDRGGWKGGYDRHDSGAPPARDDRGGYDRGYDRGQDRGADRGYKGGPAPRDDRGGGYDRGGYDRGDRDSGYDRGGGDRGGYDRGGYDRGGYDRGGSYDGGKDNGKGKGGKGSKGEPSDSKIYVENLPADIQKETLETVFATYGRVDDIHVMQGRSSKTGQSAAFIRYAYAKDARSAIAAMERGYEIQPGEGNITVKMAHDRGASGGKGYRPY